MILLLSVLINLRANKYRSHIPELEFHHLWRKFTSAQKGQVCKRVVQDRPLTRDIESYPMFFHPFFLKKNHLVPSIVSSWRGSLGAGALDAGTLDADALAAGSAEAGVSSGTAALGVVVLDAAALGAAALDAALEAALDAAALDAAALDAATPWAAALDAVGPAICSGAGA